METVLEVKNVTKKFGQIAVFKNVSFNLKKGELLAMVGENGAGKSTMMNILGGVYPLGQYEGHLLVDGKEAAFKNERDSIDAGIKMIHQEISLHQDLSVAENVYLGELPNKNGFVLWKKVYADTQKYLDLINLKVNPHTPVRNLNTSQQQLLSIAKALASNPKIILFDEPTSALTEEDAANLIKVIKGLKKDGISCIYISHRLEEVVELADRVIVLRDGNLISTYEKEEIKVDKMVTDMVGRSLEQMYPKQDIPIGDEVLRVENITVPDPYVLHKNVVENISFSVHKGEILGLSGLVGAGRSEIVNAIYGTMEKSSGKIFIDGKAVKISNPEQAINNGIGLVTENRKESGIVPSMTLRENMVLASLKKISHNGFINKKAERAVSEEYYKKLSVKATGIEALITSLSGGNQQKIVLSKWMVKGSEIKVLILDEPTRGVDVGAKVEIYNIISELAKQGMAVIMISSEMPELIGMCDRIIVIGNHKVTGNILRNEFSQELLMRCAADLENYGVNQL